MFVYNYRGVLWYINVDHIVRMTVASLAHGTGYSIIIVSIDGEGCQFEFETQAEAKELADTIMAMHSAMFDARVGKHG